MRINNRELGRKVGFTEGFYNEEPSDNSAQSTEYQEGYDEGYKEGKGAFYTRPVPEYDFYRGMDSAYRTIFL